MQRLSKVLPGVLKKRGLQEYAQSALCIHSAEQWVGRRLPSLSSFIKVETVKDGVLRIACTHSVAMQECQAVLPDLRNYLKGECPFVKIEDIKVSRC